MTSLLHSVLLGAALSSLVGWLGYRRHALTRSGAIGAVLVGTPVFGFTGHAGGTLICVFFVSSSILSRFQAQRKDSLYKKYSKGSQRDLGQVLANGSIAALAASLYSLSQTDWAWAALVGALSAATADTWATELGVLSRRRPRLISTGKPVETGTSGGLTLIGTLAAAVGAASIASLAGLFRFGDSGIILLLIGSLSGLLGSLFDSLLGSTVQAIYHCNVCAQETEQHPLHSCGWHTHLLRGWRWLNNDSVNFLGTTLGALIAAASVSHFL